MAIISNKSKIMKNNTRRLLDLFRTVFLYRYKLDRLIMDTENVHSIKYCHVDVTNNANPIDCCCDAPEGGNNFKFKQVLTRLFSM